MTSNLRTKYRGEQEFEGEVKEVGQGGEGRKSRNRSRSPRAPVGCVETVGLGGY